MNPNTAPAGSPVACTSCTRPAVAGAGLVCYDDRPVAGLCGHCGGLDFVPVATPQSVAPGAGDPAPLPAPGFVQLAPAGVQ